jgi:hypothetical protein
VEFLLKSDAEKLKSGEEKKIIVATNSYQEVEQSKNLSNSGEERKQNEAETIQPQDKNKVDIQMNKSKTEFSYSKQKENLESKKQPQIQIPPKK